MCPSGFRLVTWFSRLGNWILGFIRCETLHKVIYFDVLNVLRPPFCTLTTHSWLNWVDEDEVGWKKSQKTLDTSKRLHQNKTRSTGSGGEELDSQLRHYWELQTRKRAGLKSIPSLTWYSSFIWGTFIMDHPQCPTKSPFRTCRVPIITQILHGTLLLGLRPEAGYTFAPIRSTKSYNTDERDIIWWMKGALGHGC